MDYTFDDSKRSDFVDAIRAYYPGWMKNDCSPATRHSPKNRWPGRCSRFFDSRPRIMAYLVALIYWALSHRGSPRPWLSRAVGEVINVE